jgi:hypothetical protein
VVNYPRGDIAQALYQRMRYQVSFLKKSFPVLSLCIPADVDWQGHPPFFHAIPTPLLDYRINSGVLKPETRERCVRFKPRDMPLKQRSPDRGQSGH